MSSPSSTPFGSFLAETLRAGESSPVLASVIAETLRAGESPPELASDSIVQAPGVRTIHWLAAI